MFCRDHCGVARLPPHLAPYLFRFAYGASSQHSSEHQLMKSFTTTFFFVTIQTHNPDSLHARLEMLYNTAAIQGRRWNSGLECTGTPAHSKFPPRFLPSSSFLLGPSPAHRLHRGILGLALLGGSLRKSNATLSQLGCRSTPPLRPRLGPRLDRACRGCGPRLRR